MKTAVVTGAASGIGLDCANDLVARGWRVFALDRSSMAAPTDNLIPIACDVADSASVTAAFAQVAEAQRSRGLTPAVDALVCSAGIFRTGPLLEMAEKDFDDLFAVNTRGAWLCAKAALPLLKAAAKPEAPARIVFVASAAALRPKTGGGAYAASKAALVQITKVLAVEMAKQSILVNAIAPATVDTPMTQALAANAAANGYKLSGTSPLGRVATPGDVSSVIRFLLGDDSAYLAGAVIPIDGGTTAAFDPR
jgi:NAD(P)-dependent dehydrogenase (short-subunit alcohol dehydrogenase family)